MGNLKGLILTPNLGQGQVRSVQMFFTPSMGIMARRVDKLGLDIRSFREPLKRAIRNVVIPSIAENFAVGGRPSWSPLESDTISQKGHDQPLIRSGKLRRNMTYLSMWHIDSEKAFIADLPQRIWYGKVHQAGANFKTRPAKMKTIHITYLGVSLGRPNKDSDNVGSIPARPFVVLQPEDEIEIRLVFEEWLSERIAAAQLGRI